MSASRDDFGIAFRSALLQKGAAQKFSLFFLLIVALIIFFLDIYNVSFIKQIRSFINDGVYRVSMVASSPTRILPNFSSSISDLLKISLAKALMCFKLAELTSKFLYSEMLGIILSLEFALILPS